MISQCLLVFVLVLRLVWFLSVGDVVSRIVRMTMPGCLGSQWRFFDVVWSAQLLGVLDLEFGQNSFHIFKQAFIIGLPMVCLAIVIM